MVVDLSKMKKGQEAIRTELASLEKGAEQKGQLSFYDEEDIREMMSVLVKQNQKLERRLDYLLNMLTETSKSSSEETGKLLTAIAQSQIEVLDQLGTLQDKAESGAPSDEFKKAQDEALKAINAQMKAISEATTNLPYQQQMTALEKELGSVAEEMKNLEALVTTEAPEQLMTSVDALKADSQELRKRVDSLNSELSKIEKEEEAVLPHVAGLMKMQDKLADIDRKLGDFEDFGAKLAKLSVEVEKLERFMESYPAGAAQQLQAAKEAAGEPPDEGPLRQAYEDLQKRLADVEKEFKARELCMEDRRSAEIALILKLLEKMERQLLENEAASDKFRTSVAALEEKAKALSGKPGPEVAASAAELEKHIASVESELEQERHIESTHVEDLLLSIKEARAKLRQASGKPVDAGAIGAIQETVKEIEVPSARLVEPEEKESLAAAGEAIAAAAEEASKKEKKKLEQIGERVEAAHEEIAKTGEATTDAKEAMASIVKQASEAAMGEKRVIADYLAKLPVGRTIPIADIASEVGLSTDALERALLEMKDPNLILRDTGYGARLLGKQATLTKK